MFTSNAFIDTVQNTKKQAVETFVTDATFKKGLLEVIDAQTEFAKTVANNTVELSKVFLENFKNATKVK